MSNTGKNQQSIGHLTYDAPLMTGTEVLPLTAYPGGGQANATPLVNGVNEVSIVATAGDSVLLPPAQAGKVVYVINTGANACTVWTKGVDTINDAASFSLPAATGANKAVFVCQKSTTSSNAVGEWYTISAGNNPATFSTDANGNVTGLNGMTSSTFSSYITGIPIGVPPSCYFGNNGQFILGPQPGGGTATFGATSGSTTVTLSVAGLLGTSADNGKVITLVSGPDFGVQFTITAFSSTTVATGTLSATLTNLTAVTTWTLVNPFNRAYGGCYLRFPANSIFSGSVAALYYCVMQSTTVGTCYNNTYNGGTLSIPTIPVPWVQTGMGAVAQTLGTNITLVSTVIAGNSWGKGCLRVTQLASVPANTDNKILLNNLSAGISVFSISLNNVAGNTYKDQYLIFNQEDGKHQFSAGFTADGVTSGTGQLRTSVDTTVDNTFSVMASIPAAGTGNQDFLMLEGFMIESVFR